MHPRDWMDWAGLIIQALLLGGLIWYCIETRQIRIVSTAQLEALQTPCLTFMATPRDATDTILEIGARGGLVLDFNGGWITLLNIGTGPAVNVEYRFTSQEGEGAGYNPNGYVSFVGPGVRASVPIGRGVLKGHKYECRLLYDSLSHTRYETRLALADLVLTPPFKFGKA